MGMTIAEREHQRFAAILSEFGFSDTDDVPLSDVLRAALMMNKGCLADAHSQIGKLQEQLAALTVRLEEAQRERDEAQEILDELAAYDRSKSLAQRIRDEFTDFQMVIDHCSKIYDHFSRGRISKPNTLPSEVITIADDFATEDVNEAIEEATQELKSELEAAEQQLTEAQRDNQSMRAVLFRLTTAQGFENDPVVPAFQPAYPDHSREHLCDPAVFCVPCIAQRALDEVGRKAGDK